METAQIADEVEREAENVASESACLAAAATGTFFTLPRCLHAHYTTSTRTFLLQASVNVHVYRAWRSHTAWPFVFVAPSLASPSVMVARQ